jgi:N-acetylmuramoyl-L-alanine amidase
VQGVDLSASDDVVAGVLMDLARVETAPRADALADGLVAGIGAAGLRLHRRPRGEAGFTVLRAADIPSVLLEIGFMSEPGGSREYRRSRLAGGMQAAMSKASWTGPRTDAMRATLLRQ